MKVFPKEAGVNGFLGESNTWTHHLKAGLRYIAVSWGPEQQLVSLYTLYLMFFWLLDLCESRFSDFLPQLSLGLCSVLAYSNMAWSQTSQHASKEEDFTQVQLIHP